MNSHTLYSLSLSHTLKQASSAYLVNWKITLVIVLINLIIAGPITGSMILFQYEFPQTPEEMSNTFVAIFLSLMFIGLLFLNFLTLTLTALFDDYRNHAQVPLRTVIKKALRKVFPALFADILFYLFAILCAGILGVIYSLCIYTINYIAPPLIGLLFALLGMIVVLWASIWFLGVVGKRILYIQAIMLDDKSPWHSLKYSAELNTDWKDTLRTVTLWGIIHFVKNIWYWIAFGMFLFNLQESIILNILLSFSMFVGYTLLFPWYISCLVYWYRNLQNRGLVATTTMPG